MVNEVETGQQSSEQRARCRSQGRVSKSGVSDAQAQAQAQEELRARSARVIAGAVPIALAVPSSVADDALETLHEVRVLCVGEVVERRQPRGGF